MRTRCASLAALALVVGACVEPSVDEPALASSKAALTDVIPGPKGCPAWGCAQFKVAQVESLQFYELSTNAADRSYGLSLVSFKTTTGANLRISGNLIRFDNQFGTAPTDEQLVGAELRLAFMVGNDPTPAGTFTVVFEGVRRYLDWGPAPHRQVPFYKLGYRNDEDGDDTRSLCSTAAIADPEWQSIEPGWATLFAGDRYDLDAMSVSETSLGGPWFNVACAGTPPAQMHMLRHTSVWNGTAYATTHAQRQAMLKMLSGDYCGDGSAHPRGASSVLYVDNRLWHNPTLPPGHVVESIWTENGAVCLTEPRAASGISETQLRTDIGLHCPKPECFPTWWGAQGDVLSVNRPGFIFTPR